MKTGVINFFKGMLVGIANVIPGVSGGTIAVVLGIFDDLIYAINNFYKSISEFKKYFLFLFPIGLGCVSGILAFSSLIEDSLSKYSFQTCMFFIGLVLGSIPLIYKKATEKKHTPVFYVATFVAIGVVICMSLLKRPDMSNQDAVSSALAVKMFLGGIIAAAAMVMPGISGSFVMILLGLYYDVIHTISSLKDFLLNPSDTELLMNIIKVVVPLGIGVVLGIVLISKLISILFEKFYALTYFTILGLILGSIFGIFNDPITYQSGINALSIIIGIFTCALGFIISIFLGRE